MGLEQVAAKLPERLRAKRVVDLKNGESGWVESWALTLDEGWGCWLFKDAVASERRSPHSFLVKVVPQGLVVVWDDEVLKMTGGYNPSGDMVPDEEELGRGEYLPVAVFQDRVALCE